MPLKESIYETLLTTAGLSRMISAYESRTAMELDALSGSAFAMYASAMIRKTGGVHLFLCADRDAAAYLCNDFYSLLDEVNVLFFPTGYKRSIRFGQQDASGIVQRTAALEAISNYEPSKGPLVVCTYPEAVSEMVVGRRELQRDSLELTAGQKISMREVEERVTAFGFERVDFVYEPGQYSLRGGILDVFSYSQNRPFRLDFFGDEIDSLKQFDIASQLSVGKLSKVTVVPNFKGDTEGMVSFAEYAGQEACYWIDDVDYVLGRIDDVRKKLIAESDEPDKAASRVTSAKQFLEGMSSNGVFMLKASKKRSAERREQFATSPQPMFNKQYELLANDIDARSADGYKTYILTENRAQIERLRNVLDSVGRSNVTFEPLLITLHEGFIDHNLRACFYTDHQIFDRYHRYSLRGEIDRSQSLTVAELNELKVGDYVVHIDHGVGQFGGLVKSIENGKQHEAVKLVYRDGDVLLVNIHALHRISRYKSKESGTPPRVNKLGTGAWQHMKDATKSAVKNIARELIALYAKRKAAGGFRFSPDGYLQHELESSFPYEETADQQKAMELVRHDMESDEPMDRLVCGDVGFGKTEVAVRAALKAVCDSKQVAVLVPTTILALQHYRTFSERLRGLPARVEMLSRVKSPKEAKQIMQLVAEGKIDILVGTHKILNKELKFKSLGLLIIDEEQKFGVTAKERLRQMSVSVDTLTLTATPIPRTLQFSLMGARDLSVIATPPANRQPIITESHVFDEALLSEAIEFELSRGGQVYFLHNKVTDIEHVADMIRTLCPKATVRVGHGQMPAAKLEKLIMDFVYGEFDILVATTIIENGIDIPNANTIIIDDAQNFGLSELHQLRGRVGRSNRKSFCYLLSPPDELLNGDARRRLRAIEEFSDLGSGFNIAMQDLDIRGAGNLLGAEQSGFISNMGFETYRKILAEAVSELRAEGVTGVDEIVGDDTMEKSDSAAEEICYINDCQIETDMEALLPDNYVGQSGEKLKLYRRLDDITDEQHMQELENELRDRFGELPPEAQRLMDVVRLRWRCMSLGFERAKVKNGLMLLGFPADTASAYYKTGLFMSILHIITSNPAKFVLRQSNNKLGLTVRNVKDMKSAWMTLDEMKEKTKSSSESRN